MGSRSLVQGAAFGALLVLFGCGGGGGKGSSGSASTSTSTPVPPAPVPVPDPPTSGLTVVTLRGGAAGTQPVDFGMAFRKGDWPANQPAKGLQVNVLTTWPDGSAKTAIVSGYAKVTAGADRLVGLQAGTALTGSPISTSALQTGVMTASIDCGALGSASWGVGDWAQPFITVCEGPLMSSWVYRKPVGSDPHLVAWLEVRRWVNGETKVLPWVENGYVNVAGPTNKSATYGFTLGGTARLGAGLAIDLKHHQRTPLLSGPALWHWVGADPGLVPLHDPAYLMASEMVPSYYVSLPAGHPQVKALPTGYTPLAPGAFVYDSDSMPSSGYQKPIGLLPQHDMLHLVAHDSDRVTTFSNVVRAGYSAGRYGIHYRDEKTNRPLRFSDHPTRNINASSGFKDTGGSTTSTYTPTPSGGNPPTWDVAHSPSVGYMAHLLTGHWYFLEECQFAAVTNYLGNGDISALRTGSLGLVQTAVQAWQTRASAWDWRAHVQALAITPDADPVPGGSGNTLRQEFINRAHANIDHFHDRYTPQTKNPGFILPGETYNDSIGQVAVWQQDFVIGAWGMGMCLGLPIDAAHRSKMDAFFAWKAQSVIGRLGTPSDFPFENADRYNLVLGSGFTVDNFTTGTGPWPANWATIYAQTAPLADATSNPLSTPGSNTLSHEYDAIAGAQGQWGEMQMAIAYAVRHGVPGASAAYARMTGASNWSSMLLAGWQASWPVMSVKPASDPAATPAWARSTPVNGVVAVPGSITGIPANVITAWGCLSVVDGTLFSSANGGHHDSSDNGVYSLDLMQDAPAWTTRIAPSASVQPDVAYYADGKPVSRHGYQHAYYIPQRGRVLLFGVHGAFTNAFEFPKVDGHSLTGTLSWDVAGTYPDIPSLGGYGVAMDPRNGNVWTSGGKLWNQATNTWSTPGTYTGKLRWGWQWDSNRTRFAGFHWGDGQGYGSAIFQAQIMNPDTGAATDIGWAGDGETTASLAQIAASAPGTAPTPAYESSCYDAANDCFWLYYGHNTSSASAQVFYKITPQAGATGWTMQRVTFTGATLPLMPLTGINGRIRYIPRLGGFILMPSGDSGVYFVRTH